MVLMTLHHHKNIPGLYIHIPFCRRKCSYCNFYSTTSLDHVDEFLKSLYHEMTFYRSLFGPFDTLYIGGGTPSLLTIKQFNEVLSHIRETFRFTESPEITVEINPADLNFKALQFLREKRVTRISMGIQSFDDKTLSFLGRRHTRCQARNSIRDARRAGFDNIGLDLIYGIPGQSISSWTDTLREALSFNVEHISCYQLTPEGDTPLGKRWMRGELPLPNEDEQHAFFMTTSAILEDAGYIHYEVSNFSRNGTFISRHNNKYWNHSEYLGLGPAAHSFAGNRRWWNTSSLSDYLVDIHAGRVPVAASETLSTEELSLESLFLGLRTKEGIHLNHFRQAFDVDMLRDKGKTIKMLEETGLIRIEDGYLRPTRAGMALADSLSQI